MDLSSLKAAEAPYTAITSEEVVDTVQEMARLLVRAIRVRSSFWSTKTRVRRWPDAIIQKITKERFQVQKL
mgnify:FL=1